jgi:hypothetical protein
LEGLKLRSFVVAALLLVCGGIVMITPRTSEASPKTEEWMEKNSPLEVGKFRMLPSYEGHERVTYKMDPTTYKELDPYGIVARRFENGEQSYDVVLIASNKKTSFHDPRLCFTAQQWTITRETQTTVDTVRGSIPITVAEMIGPDKTKSIACFFYRGKDKFYSTPQALSWATFVDQLKGKNDLEGVFYRFIPLHKDASVDELKGFIRLFMQEAYDASGGFF